MSIGDVGRSESLHTAEIIRSQWVWFILLGLTLMIAGCVAIILPAFSTLGAGEVLGTSLIISGIVQIIQSSKVQNSSGFLWQLLLGILATIGGVLIDLNPFTGIVAITILIAIIFAIIGLSQIAFALKVRRMAGWYWFLVSGCIALLVSVLLAMKLPYSHSFTPATIAGVSLLFTGWAYVAITLASWKARA